MPKTALADTLMEWDSMLAALREEIGAAAPADLAETPREN